MANIYEIQDQLAAEHRDNPLYDTVDQLIWIIRELITEQRNMQDNIDELSRRLREQE